MPIKIYNTLNGKKEAFDPVEPGKVGMYVCGPTVYDSCHIGHARSVIVFDVIARYLALQNFDVTYVRNFTDVDDKIINRANQLGITSEELAEKYIKEFHEDMDALNVKRPTIEPKATQHIDQIISVIELLIKKDFAYQIDNDVYFAVDKSKDYGKLSGRKLEDMVAGSRIEVDERKQNPFDFALWKAAKPDEPFWESPWGKGRPGWHIECSAMSSEYLGKTFDIHGGGKDLIFPHHENEIAQSESAFGKLFAKYWIHNGFVNIDHEKMSKSLGNFLMIKDVIKDNHPEAVRLFLLSNHYRSPIDFTDKSISEANAGLDKIYTFLGRIEDRIGEIANDENIESGPCMELFCQAMDDDFNTARGIGILFDTVRKFNRMMDDSDETIAKKDINSFQQVRKDILKIGEILGLLTEKPKDYFEKKKTSAVQKQSIDNEMIEKLIQERTDAREAKDWEKADQIRKTLSDMNITLEDKSGKTIWKIDN